MAIVSYGGNAIIPSPFVSIITNPIVADNQTRIGTTYNLTLNGTIVSFMGSPLSSGVVSANYGGPNNQFWIAAGYPPNESNPSNAYQQLSMLENKITALQALFSQDGLTLAFQSPNGATPLTCNPRNAVFTVEEGNWFNEVKYTITMDTDTLYVGNQVLQSLPASGYIQSSSEAWQINPGQIIDTFDVQHTVSAVGKEFFTSSGTLYQHPWQNARDYVLTQLVLGWSGISPYSNIPGSSIFNQSSLGNGVLNFNNFSPYNFSRSENVDELAGSYSVTEQWLTAQTSSGTHIYTVSTTRIAEEPYSNVVANIQGEIKGFYINLFDYNSRLANATYVWEQLAAPTGLVSLVNQYTNSAYSGLFNLQPRAGSVDFNYQEGSISYQYQFTNTLYEGDAFEQYTVSRKTSTTDYISSFNVAGNIKGRRYDGDISPYAAFGRAYTYWATVSGQDYNSLYQRVITSTYFPEASGLGIQPSPTEISVDFNQGEGSINYSFIFNNRVADFGGAAWNNQVIDEYQVSQHFSVDDGITTYGLQGSVQGLNISDNNPRQVKYSAATGYFYNFVVPNLYSRVTGIYNVSLPNPNPLVSEITLFPVFGQVQYSYEFRNTFPPLLPGVLSEHITVQENNYNQQVAVIGQVPVLGRAQGPVLQQMNSSIAKTRTLTIEAVMSPTGSLTNLLAAFNTKPTGYDVYALQLTPTNGYCTAFSDSYDWKSGHYSLTCEWVYE